MKKRVVKVPAQIPQQRQIQICYASHLHWELEDAIRQIWKLRLVSGMIKICIWDGRVKPILWPWFDGFRCQIIGEKTIDFEFPGVTNSEEAKQLAVMQVVRFLHQLGAELGLWTRKVTMDVTEPTVLFKGRIMVKK